MATLREFAASRQSAGATGLKVFTASRNPTEWKPINIQKAPTVSAKPTVKTAVKPVSSQVKITQPTLSPIDKARQTLGDISTQINKTIQNVIGGVNMLLVSPQAKARKEAVSKPQAQVQAKPVQITPGQKKLTPDQLQSMLGGLDTTQPEQSAQIPPETKSKIPQLRTIVSDLASKAANKLSKESVYIGPTRIGTVGEGLSEIGAVLSGNTFLPEDRKQYDKLDAWSKLSEATKVFGAIVPMGSMRIPTEMEGAKDIASFVRGLVGGYGMGSLLNYAAQDPKKRSIEEAIKPNLDNVLFGYLTGLVGVPDPFESLKKEPAISKGEYVKARDFLKEMGVKEDVFSKPEALKKAYFDLAKKNHPDTGGSAAMMAKINKAFKTVTETFYDVAKTGDKPNIAGLLEDGEKTPSEVINTVLKNKLEKTTEGKALIKTAVEAQRQGKSIMIEKPVQPSTPQEWVGGGDKILQVEEGVAKGTKYNPEDADLSLLTSEEVKNLETQDTEQKKAIREKIANLREDVEMLRQENEVKKSILDKFSGKTIRAMRSLKRSMIVAENRGLDMNEVQKLPTYDEHIFSVMESIGTDSEQEALRYIREDLPDAIVNADTREKLQEIRILQSHITPKEVSVPREQLPVGEGKPKATALESRIKKVIDNATPEELESLGLSISNTAENEKQLSDAAKYLSENRQEAMDVLEGKRDAPKGLLRNAIYVAAVQEAKTDLTLATKLAGLSSKRFGQEIQILSRIDPNSSVKLLNEVYNIREEEFKKRYAGRKPTEVKKAVVKSIKKQIKAPDKSDWNAFINSIDTC